MKQRRKKIDRLAEALARAQSEIRDAETLRENTFVGSKYADLTAVWNACRIALTKNGLSVVQTFNGFQ